jgi:hypothetical protein
LSAQNVGSTVQAHRQTLACKAGVRGLKVWTNFRVADTARILYFRWHNALADREGYIPLQDCFN